MSDVSPPVESGSDSQAPGAEISTSSLPKPIDPTTNATGVSPATEQNVNSPNPGLKRNAHWRAIQHTLQVLFGVWLGYRARGAERANLVPGGLVVSNHQSFLDPLLIGLPLRRPVSFLARDSLFRVPVIGYILRNTYVMPINRDAATTASLREMLRRISLGYLVGIFPEGTRTADGSLGEFRPGFLAVIRRSGAPVYPVGIAGAYHAMPRKAIVLRPARVRVVFGEPMMPEELAAFGKDDAALTAFVRERVAKTVAEAEAWRTDSEAPASETT